MSMKAWQLSAFGLEHLNIAERPIPTPQDGELLVRVAAVSLNYRDKLVVEGRLLPEPPSMPFVPVSDMAGEIVALGSGVTRFRIGERVMANFWTEWIDGKPPQAMRRHGLSLGGPLPGVLAEYVVVPETVAVPVPLSLSDEEASTLPVAALTAWFALIETGRLEAGETVLVQETGGVSLFGMLFARALGASAIVTSRDEAKLNRAKALGASHVINTSRTPDWAAAAVALTNDRGVDHVLELIGGDNLRQSVDALADGGWIAMIGFLRSSKIELSPMPLMLRRGIIQGISVGHRRAFEDMVSAIDQYRIKPVIDHIYPFDYVRAAFDHLAGGAFGKIVITLSA